MVKRILAAGLAGLLLASPAAAAVDVVSSAAVLYLANSACPAGTFSRERLEAALELAQAQSGMSMDDFVWAVGSSAFDTKQLLIETDGLDAWCASVRVRLSAGAEGN